MATREQTLQELADVLKVGGPIELSYGKLREGDANPIKIFLTQGQKYEVRAAPADSDLQDPTITLPSGEQIHGRITEIAKAVRGAEELIRRSP